METTIKLERPSEENRGYAAEEIFDYLHLLNPDHKMMGRWRSLCYYLISSDSLDSQRGEKSFKLAMDCANEIERMILRQRFSYFENEQAKSQLKTFLGEDCEITAIRTLITIVESMNIDEWGCYADDHRDLLRDLKLIYKNQKELWGIDLKR